MRAEMENRKMTWQQFAVYFVIGGAVLSLSVYFGAQGKGFLAAVITNFPSVTLLTFILLWNSGGLDTLLPYAKGLFMVIPPWVAYALLVIFLTPKAGPLAGIGAGLTAYVTLAIVIQKLFLNRPPH